MDLYDVFSSPSILYEANSFDDLSKLLKLKLKTEDIEGSTTLEEVFILSKKHFDDVVIQYKNHYFGDIRAKQSSYRLFISMVKDNDLSEYNIYSIDYDNIKDKITNENKYYSNFKVEGNFNININVSVRWWEDYNSDEEEDSEDDKPARKTISESECIICFENKPNMLYLECMHLCVCNVCDGKGKFYKCPMCRTKLKNQKIRITYFYLICDKIFSSLLLRKIFYNIL